MELNGTQYKKIRETILGAYRRKPALKIMVRDELDENLDMIVPPGTLEEIVHELIDWCQSKGRLNELLAGAYRGNSTNIKLQELYKEYGLDNLLNNQISAQYRKWEPQIMEITFGLPKANLIVDEELRRIERMEEIILDVEFFQRRFNHLVHQCLVEKLLPEHIMLHLSKEDEELLFVLSPLRRLTGREVAYILSQCVRAYSSGLTEKEGLNILQKLEKTSWVHYSSERQAKMIREPDRNIIALALKIKEPALYFHVHQVAVELFSKMINSNFTEDRRHYIKESLLHQAYVLQNEKPEVITLRLCTELDNWIETCYMRIENSNISAVDNLYNLLKDDKWREELENLAPNSFARILSTFDKYLRDDTYMFFHNP
jgi:hypothetical protein